MASATAPAPTPAPWGTVDVQFLNDTYESCKPHEDFGPVSRACTVEIDQKHATTHGGDRATADIENKKSAVRIFAKSSGEASTFLSFDIGVEGYKLVVWIWLLPQHSALESRVRIQTQIVIPER
jgi:hypothetical protein